MLKALRGKRGEGHCGGAWGGRTEEKKGDGVKENGSLSG